MFKSMFDVFNDNPIIAFIIIVLVALVLGLLTSISYMYYKRKSIYTRDMPVMMVILPPVVAILIGITNLSTSDSTVIAVGGVILTGMFALTRFRSEPLSIIDLTFVVISSSIGMGSGLGYVTYTSILVLVILLAMIVISLTSFGQVSSKSMKLRIFVPEDFNYEHAFDEILKKYCVRYSLFKVRTTDGGQLFDLHYHVVLKSYEGQKTLIDEIRMINGNLDVFLTSSVLES